MRLLSSWADDVARGLLAVVAVVDPALVVLGGGIGRRPEVVAGITTSLAGLTSRVPRLVAGALGDWAGVVGAAMDAVPLPAATDGSADRQERA
ncbi:MAG: ROK family protein [Egicoccus sp.]